jgi:hypothetical protein
VTIEETIFSFLLSDIVRLPFDSNSRTIGVSCHIGTNGCDQRPVPPPSCVATPCPHNRSGFEPPSVPRATPTKACLLELWCQTNERDPGPTGLTWVSVYVSRTHGVVDGLPSALVPTAARTRSRSGVGSDVGLARARRGRPRLVARVPRDPLQARADPMTAVLAPESPPVLPAKGTINVLASCFVVGCRFGRRIADTVCRHTLPIRPSDVEAFGEGCCRFDGNAGPSRSLARAVR